ncbi:MAG: hypothetical protein K2N56_06045 [Oscillospiraceae bacterium]|nr:hypothetical protein [Oscillospiraceae bacterium]
MKHLKISIAALLAACLLLTGCDNSAQNDENSSDSSSSTSTIDSESSNKNDTSDPQGFQPGGAENFASSGEPDNSDPAGNTEKPKKLTETEQIFKMLKDYGNLYWRVRSDSVEKLTDPSQKINIEVIGSDGSSYKNVYYKITSVLPRTESELNEKLDSLVTEDLKTEFLDPVIGDLIKIKDGDLYIRNYGAYGMGMGMSKLILNSIEYPDENTVLVNMTDFGDKIEWEMEKDIEDKFTVRLVRTDNGLRIAELSENCEDALYHYKEIYYGDISFSF